MNNGNYDMPQEMNSTHPGWTILVSNILRLQQKDHIYKRKRAKSGFNLLMGSEQKSAAWMKDIVQRFTRPVNLVVDACDGAFFITNQWKLLPKHRRCIGCEVDLSCVTEAVARLILLCA